MAEITRGYKPGSDPAGWGWASAGTMRGTTIAGRADHIWIRAIGGRVGRYTGSTVTGRFAIYQANASTWMPGARLGNTNTFNVTAYMIDRVSGGNYHPKVLAPIPVRAGVPLTIAFLGTGAAWSHGQDHSGETMHERDGLSSLPSTFGSTWSRPEGRTAFWYTAEVNAAPTIPLSTVSPANGASTTDETPLLAMDFRDANELIPGFGYGDGDYLKAYRFEVWNDARTGRLRNSGKLTATGGQRSARRATWTVPTDLAPGRYTIRGQVYDHFDTPSAWREWKITVVSSGSIVVNEPDTKINDTTPDLDWSYTHRQGLAVERVIARITTPSGTIVRADEEFDISPPASPPASGPFFWPAAWPELTVGADYHAQMQAVDTDGQPSPWSAPSLFHVNSPPSDPADLSPSDGQVSITVPQLSAVMVDPDDETSTLDGRFVIRRQGETAETEASGLWRADTNRWYIDPVAAGMIANGDHDTYEWTCFARDPMGLQSTAAPWRAFEYAPAPVVTQVEPVDTITVSNPAFAWTVDRAQTQYRIQLWDRTTGAAIRNGDTGWVTSAVSEHTYHDLLLRNEQEVTARIDVITTGGIPGYVEWEFDVQYIPPPPVTGVATAAIMGDFDMPNNPTQVEITWDEVTTDELVFDSYVVRRRNLDTGETVTLAMLSGIDQTRWVDDTAGSGVVYEYQVTQRVWEAIDLLESEPDTAQASVTLNATVLSVVIGGSGRVVLPYRALREIAPERDKQIRNTWSSKARVLTGPRNFRHIRYEANVLNDLPGHDRFTAADLVAVVHEMGAPWQDATGAVRDRVLCYRDPRGTVAYVSLMNAPEHDERSRYSPDMTLEMVEVGYTPGGEA